METDVNSKALTLFSGLQKTYYNGSTWTETDTEYPSFALILDTDTPFASQGGGLAASWVVIIGCGLGALTTLGIAKAVEWLTVFSFWIK